MTAIRCLAPILLVVIVAIAYRFRLRESVAIPETAVNAEESNAADEPAKESGDIHKLIDAGNTEKVKALLAADPSLKNARDKMRLTPLHSAVLAKRADIVKHLIELGVDMNAECYNEFRPLHFAESPEIIKLLIEGKATSKPRASAERLCSMPPYAAPTVKSPIIHGRVARSRSS